ncbi:hypothetical protein F2P81_002982 [Scophthalmus maximus]|uniref:Uncharacterized protein n=1 Tax=Scophthalmus maximus TaxID=52904 RepID=A0A6A4TKT9_SCOMX|nr:hypothetical protein F2P81_002982 [Scophthalmus maximus]
MISIFSSSCNDKLNVSCSRSAESAPGAEPVKPLAAFKLHDGTASYTPGVVSFYGGLRSGDADSYRHIRTSATPEESTTYEPEGLKQKLGSDRTMDAPNILLGNIYAWCSPQRLEHYTESTSRAIEAVVQETLPVQMARVDSRSPDAARRKYVTGIDRRETEKKFEECFDEEIKRRRQN